MSTRKEREIADSSDLRQAFRMEFPNCAMCGRPGHDVHEIARGAYRSGAVASRAALLTLCRTCHGEINDLERWPIARQLALKRVFDPLGYNREEVNSLRGRALNAITEAEVWAFVEGLPDCAVWKFPIDKLSPNHPPRTFK